MSKSKKEKNKDVPATNPETSEAQSDVAPSATQEETPPKKSKSNPKLEQAKALRKLVGESQEVLTALNVALKAEYETVKTPTPTPKHEEEVLKEKEPEGQLETAELKEEKALLSEPNGLTEKQLLNLNHAIVYLLSNLSVNTKRRFIEDYEEQVSQLLATVPEECPAKKQLQEVLDKLRQGLPEGPVPKIPAIGEQSEQTGSIAELQIGHKRFSFFSRRTVCGHREKVRVDFKESTYDKETGKKLKVTEFHRKDGSTDWVMNCTQPHSHKRTDYNRAPYSETLGDILGKREEMRQEAEESQDQRVKPS